MADHVNILIVDDDAVTCRMMSGALQQFGYRAQIAHSCAEAQQLLEFEPFSALIVDLNLPDMDGLDFSAGLRAKPAYRDIPILMITGSDDRQTIDRAFDVGITDFIAKPINLNLLNYRVRFALHASRNLQRLIRSEARLSKAQKIARLGNWEWYADTDTVWWSEGLTRLVTGRDEQRTTSLDEFLAVFESRGAALLHDALASCVLDRNPIEIEMHFCDHSGTPRNAILQGEALDPLRHQLHGVFGTLLDVTLRRETERALHENREKFRELYKEYETILNGIPDPLTVWSRDLSLLWSNSAAQRTFTPFVGTALPPCIDFCLGCRLEQEGCFAEECLASGGRPRERMITDPLGRVWGVKVFPLRNPDGEIARLIRLSTDITEKIRLQEGAARTAHLAALGEIAAGVAHEINNPTGLIFHGLETVRDVYRDLLPLLDRQTMPGGSLRAGGMGREGLLDEIPRLLDDMIDGTVRIRRIVEELRDFSLPGEPRRFVPVDLNEVARKAISLVGSQLRNATDRFELACAPTAPLVNGNRQRLEQVVVNLLLNATQALPDRSRGIRLETACDAARGCAVIRVCDEGCGIPAELRTKIATPFFTTRRGEGGTGLGLSISSRIVGEHDGNLLIDSAAEQGTKVTVELPLLAAEGAPHA